MTDTVPRSPQRQAFLADVIVAFVEGGSSYHPWFRVSGYRWFFPDLKGGSAEPGPDGTPNAYCKVQVEEGKSWGPKYDLNPDVLEAAFERLMEGKVEGLSDHIRARLIGAWAVNDGGNVDACDADIMVQVALLKGEVVYG